MQALGHTYPLLVTAIVIFMSLMFGFSRLIGKRNDLVDIAWGLGFIVVAATSYASSPVTVVHWQQVLPVALVIIWGLRLSLHILGRFLKSAGDPRYLAMQAKWGKHVELQSYLRVFLAQGFLILLVSTPVIIATTSAPTSNLLCYIGGFVWMVGFIFESTGDRQLAQFLRRPDHKGKLLTSGLWQYSRHPNYFGEVIQWWGLAIIAFSAPWGWLGIIGAAIITVLITKVSGIPITEARYKGRADWEQYASRTSALVPLPPRRKKA